MKRIIIFPTIEEAKAFILTQPRDPVFVAGVGAAEIAAATIRAVKAKKPQLAVLAGIAGAYDRTLQRGEVVEVVTERIAGIPERYAREYETTGPDLGLPLAAGITVNRSGDGLRERDNTPDPTSDALPQIESTEGAEVANDRSRLPEAGNTEGADYQTLLPEAQITEGSDGQPRLPEAGNTERADYRTLLPEAQITEGADGQTLLSETGNTEGADYRTLLPEAQITEGSDGQPRLPEAGNTERADDQTLLPEAQITEGADDRTRLPETGSTEGADNQTLLSETGNTERADYRTLLPEAQIMEGADDQPALPEIENMEGAAFFAVCEALGVACCQIRAVSNYVGEPFGEWAVEQAVGNLTEKLTQLFGNDE